MPGEDSRCFARQYRLTKTDEFSSVFGFRKAIRGQLLMLHFQPRQSGDCSARLGLVIGKKQLKKAVDRNLVKRIIREIFRLRRTTLPACDLIVRTLVKMVQVDRQQISADINQLLDRLMRPTKRPVKTP